MKRKILCLLMTVIMLHSFLRQNVHASEEPIAVGGIHILKTDLTGTPLEGAVFQIVRIATQEELQDRTVEKEMLKLGEENRVTVKISFWDHRAMTGERQLSVTTDREGKAAVYGLPYGTYYLVESKAPEGYNRMTEPLRLTIHKYSHLIQTDQVRDDAGEVIDNTLHIINVRYSLPDTGSLASVQLAAAGTGIIFSSAALILLNRKRWK